MYRLKAVRQTDNMVDYDILYNDAYIGELDITINEKDVFIRHIGIKAPFRRRGHARKVLEHVIELFKKNISFCIATHSDSAVKFWNRILAEKEHEHIRGNVYQLKKSA